MKNFSKKLLESQGYDYKKIALILNITERQAFNILSGKNKSLYKYLIISLLINKNINDIFILSDDEIKDIKKRVELINSL
jgi:hypothetical protein